METLSESSPEWTEGDETFDPDETWMLSAEVKLREVKWKQLLRPFFFTGRAFAVRKILDPPKYEAMFVPLRSSSPLRKSLSEEGKKELERYNKFLEQMENVEQQRRHGRRVPKPYFPDPETPERKDELNHDFKYFPLFEQPSEPIICSLHHFRLLESRMAFSTEEGK